MIPNPMYIDVNIGEEYPESQSCHLDGLEYDGFCINRKLRTEDVDGYERMAHGLCTEKRIYERVEVRVSRDILVDVRKARKADVFVLNSLDSRFLLDMIKMDPDMVTFDYADACHEFDISSIREAIKRDIFFEIPVVDALCRDKKMMWMRNVRRLLEVTRGRNVVMSSGARYATETKSPWDLLKILDGLGVDGGVGRKILLNSERLLRCCGLRRRRMFCNMV